MPPPLSQVLESQGLHIGIQGRLALAPQENAHIGPEASAPCGPEGFSDPGGLSMKTSQEWTSYHQVF